ncbi:hypothetical protein DV735_g571, partial [Chaetothyriales sp. CBS 134920]
MSAPNIDEINKIRKAVGLPLLPSANGPNEEGPSFKERQNKDDDDHDHEDDGQPGSTLETREAAGFDNFRQLQEEERRRIERAKRKKELQRARDAAARLTKLEGKGLGDAGDADDADLDAKAWLKGSKKRQAKIEKQRAEQLERELAERDRLAAIEYKSSDLAGVKVAHEIGDFEDASSEHILTLKDTEIGKGEDGSEDEDVLENADLVARDKLEERLSLKKKQKKGYDVHADSASKALLSQYDEAKRKVFQLDSRGAGVDTLGSKTQEIGDRLKSTISLDVLQPEAVSDYMEIKVKKPKKAKKNKRKQNGGAADPMDVDESRPQAKAKARSGDAAINDDEDLATALALSRKATLKKQKRRPEDIARQLKEEEAEEEAAAAAAAAAQGEGGIVLDDTTTFLDNLSARPREEERRPKVRQSIERPAESPGRDADGDETMREPDAVAVAVSDKEADEHNDKLRREQTTATPEISHTGLDEEQTANQGTAAMLKLLKQRGLVEESDAAVKNELYKKRQDFIIEARLREYENEQIARAQRERDRQSGKMSGMSLKEREEHARRQNSQREHQSSIQAAASFNRDYKPDVQLKYVDDTGRELNQKEAFKHLSHQFHGKGSGKLKTEKHLKKLADERRRMAASVLDSSQATGMSNAAGAQSRKNKEAGVRLA